MKAVVVAEEYERAVGDEIEVIGFIGKPGWVTAVYRDDEGFVSTISTTHIRMLPNTESIDRFEDALSANWQATHGVR